MKKILSTLVAAVLGLTAVAQLTHVRVNPKEGDAVVFSFESQPEITMMTDGIKVTSQTGSPVSFEFEKIANIDFVSSSEVKDAYRTDVNVQVYPDRIEFTNVPEGTTLRVHSLTGQTLRTVNASGHYTLNKADFAHGVYVVSVGNTTFKVSI